MAPVRGARVANLGKGMNGVIFALFAHDRAKVVGGTMASWSEVSSGTEGELTIPASIAYANVSLPSLYKCPQIHILEEPGTIRQGQEELCASHCPM